MSVRRETTAKVPTSLDDLVDAEVPAAVVCAHCGDADCPGCLHDRTESGVVAIVPWERPGTWVIGRLWITARATTFEAERFFETLPDGPIAPALRFAILSELIASTAMVFAVFLPFGLCAPGWVAHLFRDELGMLLRLVASGVCGLAALLVAAHAAHGWALGFGARRSGARAATSRAIRFGLYATGWDVIVGPLGALVLGARGGPGAIRNMISRSMGLPGRSARAFLRGTYRLVDASAVPALRASLVAAVVATAVGTVAVIAAVLAALLA